MSSLAAGHLTLVPALKAALEKEGRPDIMIVVGGVIPPQDFQALYDAGAAAIFPPGTVIPEAPSSCSTGFQSVSATCRRGPRRSKSAALSFPAEPQCGEGKGIQRFDTPRLDPLPSGFALAGDDSGATQPQGGTELTFASCGIA